MKVLVYSYGSALVIEFLSLPPKPEAVVYLLQRGFREVRSNVFIRVIPELAKRRRTGYYIALRLRRMGYEAICRVTTRGEDGAHTLPS